MNPDQLVAHRGYQKNYPENTLIAYQKAIEAGATFIETDIQFSADFVPLLYHDETLDRVSGRSGVIRDLSGAALLQISAHEPLRFDDQFIEEKITPLSALMYLLRANPQVTAYVELKEEAIAYAGRQRALERVLAELKSVIEQVILISYDYECMASARQNGFPRVGAVLEHWSDWQTLGSPLLILDCVFCNRRKIPRHVDLSEMPYPVNIYEINQPDMAQYWLERGANKIESFDIGGLLKSAIVSEGKET